MSSFDTTSTLWKNYKATYYDSLLGLQQIEIQSVINREVLKDFPANLPTHFQDALSRGLTDIAEGVKKASDMAEKGETGSFSIDTEGSESGKKLINTTFYAYISAMGSKNGNGKAIKGVIQEGFERSISSQTIIMLFAHVDAFLADTARVICLVHPEILKNEKKIDWATAIAFENKEQLMEYLRERFVLEFGSPNITKRIKYLSKDLNIKINYSNLNLELLDEAENARHIIIHNGGKVSQEYLERTKRTDLSIGEFLPTGFDYADSVAKASHKLINEVFQSVSEKFFDAKESDTHSLS